MLALEFKMALSPPPEYSFQQPTLLAKERKAESSGFHPVSSLLGLLCGLIIVGGLMFAVVYFSKSAPVPAPSLLTPQVTKPPLTKEAAVSADYNSAVVGSPKQRVGSLFETQKISLQDAAMLDTLRINQPIGKVYKGKPLKEIDIQSTPLPASDPLYKEALSTLSQYQKETQLQAKCLTTHQSQTSEPRMVDFYGPQAGSEPALGSQSRGTLINMGEAQLIQLDFPCSNRTDGKATAFFHRASSGLLRLDWEAFVGYSSVSWSEYRRTKPQTPIWLRAIASAGEYYNYEFSDKARYLCVKLTSPDGIHKIYGYVPRAVKLADLFLKRLNYEQLELTGSSKEMMKVVVKTTFHYPAESDQCVNIRDIIIDRWFHFDWETEEKP